MPANLPARHAERRRQDLRHPLQRADGSLGYFEATVSLIHDLQGELQGYRGIVRDVSDQIAYQQQLLEMAYRDPLTGLGNRQDLRRAARPGVARAGSGGLELALLYLDLDRFKEVNDRFGHDVGDALPEGRRRARAQHLRQPDKGLPAWAATNSRILEDSQENNPRKRLAERLLAALVQPLALNSAHRLRHPGIGIASIRDAGDAEGLVRAADSAACTRPSASAATVPVLGASLKCAVKQALAGFRRESAGISAASIGEPFPMPALSDPQYLGEGLKLIMRPGLRLFVLIP